MVKNKRYAAVSSGASTPTYLTNQVIDYLKQFDINDSKTYQKPIIDKNKILNQKMLRSNVIKLGLDDYKRFT